MGCDIHIFVEKFDIPSKTWFMTRDTITHADDRNYAFFARLAGVRGEGPPPKGLPLDTSLGVKDIVRQWDTDAHSRSWYSIDDFLRIYKSCTVDNVRVADLRIRQGTLDKDEERELESYLNFRESKAEFSMIWDRNKKQYVPDKEHYRVVFFFDN